MDEKGRRLNQIIPIAVITIWATIKRLLFSKKTIGIVVLCLTPIILFSLWRFDMFPQERELLYDSNWGNIAELDEEITNENINIGIDPMLMNITFSNFTQGTPLLQLSLQGTSSGLVDHLFIKIFIYLDETLPPINLIDQVSPLLNGTLRGPIDFSGLVFKGTGPNGEFDWSSWVFEMEYRAPSNNIENFNGMLASRLGFYIRAFSDNITSEKDWNFVYKELWLEIDGDTVTDSGVVGLDTKDVTFIKDGYNVFFDVVTPLYFILIIPLITILYAISVVREDIENHTIVYLITRPVSKTEIIFYKYKGFFLSAWIPISISLSISYFITVSKEGSIFLHLDYLGTLLFLITLTILAYGAVFFIFALITSHPIVLSLLYVFFLENIISQQSNVINRFSIIFHIQSIADGMLGEIANVGLYQTLNVTDSIIILISSTIVLLGIAFYIFSYRDFT